MWETQASNSLVFTREIKSHKPLWLFLMIYDLVSSSFIEENFSDVHATQCLLNMQIFYVKLNHAYSLSIGRFLPELDEEQLEIVTNILQNYGFEGMNVFELMTLVKKRKTFETNVLVEKIQYIQKAFKLFFEIQDKLIDGLPKDELVLIFLFICMATDNKEREEIFLQTKNYYLSFKNGEVTIEQNIANESQSQNFKKRLLYFQNNADFFRTEYASRLMNSLAKRYSGFQDNNYSIVDDLLQHICRRVNADAGCYIKYNLSDESLEMCGKYGEEAYVSGINHFIEKINRDRNASMREQSRVLQVIKNYYNPDYRYNLEKLIIRDFQEEKLLQPIEGKLILSNIALPLTFNRKLLGVLLIDSFRVNNFTDSDINLILSISSALSVQIFDQIVEDNLSSIMNNLPQQPTLDSETVQEHFKKLTSYMNNIFFSYGITIWRYDTDKKHFKLKATTLTVDTQEECFVEASSNNLILDLLEEGVDEVEECDLKRSCRLNVCNPCKSDERLKCVKIYAIKNRGKVIGAFSIYNSSAEDYKSIDKQSLEAVKKHLAIFFNIMHTLKAQQAMVQSKALHEISAKFNMMENKTFQLKELLNRDFKELDHYARFRFNIKLQDIDNLVGQTRLAFQYISDSSRRPKEENHVDDEIVHLYRPLLEKPKRNNLRYIFNEVINSIPYPYSRKNLRIRNVIDEKIELQVDALILQDIFQNLILNAYKYSDQGTLIEFFSSEEDEQLAISIKNIGLKILKGEEIDIFKFGYRGFSTRGYTEQIEDKSIDYSEKEDENLGVGLYKCNKMVKELLNGEIGLSRGVSSIPNRDVNTFTVYISK